MLNREQFLHLKQEILDRLDQLDDLVKEGLSDGDNPAGEASSEYEPGQLVSDVKDEVAQDGELDQATGQEESVPERTPEDVLPEGVDMDYVEKLMVQFGTKKEY